MGDVRHHAHAVYVLACLYIVECIEYDVEGLEEEEVKLGIHDIGVLRLDCHVVAKGLHL